MERNSKLLDSRIKALSDVLTCFDIERAKQFIGKKGYFTDVLGVFQNLRGCVYGELFACERGSHYPYRCGDCGPGYAFYIPESILKPEENETDKPLTSDNYEKCMKEIMDLRTELNSIKSQLNKTKSTEQNKSANCCASPDGLLMNLQNRHEYPPVLNQQPK